MKLLRKFLILIKKQHNTKGKRFIKELLIVAIPTIVIGFLLDKFAPVNIFVNVFRMLIGIISALSVFSLYYVYIFNKGIDINRNILSYKQRVNLFIILETISFVLLNVFVKPGTLVFTFMFTLFVVITLALLTFMRPTKLEVNSKKDGVEDYRDFINR